MKLYEIKFESRFYQIFAKLINNISPRVLFPSEIQPVELIYRTQFVLLKPAMFPDHLSGTEAEVSGQSVANQSVCPSVNIVQI